MDCVIYQKGIDGSLLYYYFYTYDRNSNSNTVYPAEIKFEMLKTPIKLHRLISHLSPWVKCLFVFFVIKY